MGCNGIDVSNNNGRLSLAGGFTGLDFVIAKATEGFSFTDLDYAFYQSETLGLGKLFGAYHFGHPELLDGRREAEHFMSVARPRSALSLWYDYEVYGASGAADAEVISTFIETVKLSHPHAKVGVYFNLTGAERILPLNEVPADAWWLAEYNNQLETPDAPLAKYGKAWSIHQYEVFGGIDRDYSRWTRDEMRQFFGNWPAA